MYFNIIVCSILLWLPLKHASYDILIISIGNKTQKANHVNHAFDYLNHIKLKTYKTPPSKYSVDEKQFMRMEDFDPIEGDDKIVGGFEADINWYPYHVGYGTNCGGCVIAAQWIATAGHCGVKPYIKAGSKYLGRGKWYKVAKNYIHPGWKANDKEHPFDFDFQLVKLERQLQFSENVQPVKIARMEDMTVGKVITVTGWGNTLENGPYSTVLRAVRVPIISKRNCQKVPFPYFKGTLTQRMFCAGFYEGLRDACQGDSGGPAVSDGRLIGMVSFGYGCATPQSYGVYSKIALVRPWIQEVTGLDFD